MNSRSAGAGCVTGLAALMTLAACGESPVGSEPETSSNIPHTEQSALATAALPGPDFVVSSVTGPASVRDSEWFDATVTVCNQGTEPGSAPVELYLSADRVISPAVPLTPLSDVMVAELPPESLAPGQCKTRTVNARASVNIQGAYHLGAIVNPRNGAFESDRSNNTRAGSPIGVGRRPDFIVSSVTGPASTPQGQSFPATVTVCNPGTEPGSTSVKLYLSADAIITPDQPVTPASDRALGELPVGSLAPGQCKTESLNVTAQLPRDGAYYLGAIVDPAGAVLELNDDNNARAGSRIGVGRGADFVVTSVTGPTSIAPGQPLTGTVKVCNQGTDPGGAPVELYLTADTVITPHVPPNPLTDVRLGGQDTGALAPGACRTLTFTGTPGGVPEGAYYLGAIVDPAGFIPELIDDNNTRLSAPVGVGSRPDLVVSSVTAPTSISSGQPLTATVQVCNQGTTPSGSTQADVFLSPDSAITPADAPLGMASLGVLAPGECQDATVTGTPGPFQEGTYFVGAIVDRANTVPEFVETNNTKAGSRIGVGDRPDFVVQSVTGPASIQQGQWLAASVRVCNQGTRAEMTPVELYLSADTVISPNTPSQPSTDAFVGRAFSEFLAPGACQTVTVEGFASGMLPEGAYYLGAAVNPQNQAPEFFVDNNTKAGSRIGVGDRPDFVVASATAPASVPPGQPFTANIRVCNQGTQPGGAHVELYLSEDTVITPPMTPGTPSDQPAGYFFTPTLAPGECLTQSLQASGPGTGAMYLGAVVDPFGHLPELIDDNNSRTGTRITFAY
ncbi:CARDB domain-containing protein [Pyxidicoccus xibeiensis]|uniref:CARDB domain-containing protein n=1 Tax=Pyxidicoccus xibeiensis TaxID=2906759 RepID=UPI0020A80F41|nr:CARDB domain-containing protein [Pyxidicoccus xibeiensis]MCP3141926.1 hypothetical protein [Pyxidicoccus xibeiensis]